MQIRIHGSDLPGRSCGAGDNLLGYQNIHVAIQRRNRPGEWIGMTRGDAPAVEWILDCDLVDTPTGPDFTGRYIQGRPHERFIYLSWGAVDPDGTFEMFRRAKLWLSDLDPVLVEAARDSGSLVARLGLSDAKGHPLCASVRPPLVVWSAQ